MMLADEFVDIVKAISEDGKLGGIYMGIPTGNILDDDNSFIEVLLYGHSFFAKPCMAFGSYNIPDKEWLDEYKDEINIWVAFENGNSAHPVYLGIAPRDNKVPSGNFPRIKTFKTVKFERAYDDSEEKFSLVNKNTKNGFRIDNDHTILGKGGKDQSAVLGKALKSKLEDALTNIASSLSSLVTDTLIISIPNNTAVHNPTTILSIQEDISKLNKIRQGLDKILSNNVKLD